MSDDPYEAPHSLESQESETDSIEMASRFIRLVARVIDWLLLAICTALLFSLLEGPQAWLERYTRSEAESIAASSTPNWYFLWSISSFEDLLYFCLGVLGTLILQGYLLKTYGQTIGKRILNLKILMLDSRGKPTFARSFGIRECGIALVDIVPIAGLIDILFIFGRDKRCLHDYWSGTIVVNAS